MEDSRKYGKPMACRLPLSVSKEIEQLAREKGVSRSHLVRRIALHGWKTFDKDFPEEHRVYINS